MGKIEDEIKENIVFEKRVQEALSDLSVKTKAIILCFLTHFAAKSIDMPKEKLLMIMEDLIKEGIKGLESRHKLLDLELPYYEIGGGEIQKILDENEFIIRNIKQIIKPLRDTRKGMVFSSLLAFMAVDGEISFRSCANILKSVCNIE
jgi:hypothetical protein